MKVVLIDDHAVVREGYRALISRQADMEVVAEFADAGSAYDDSPEFSESVGLGLRWFSPLGPIRLDVAHPLEDTGQTVRLHISLGPDI